MGGRIAGGYIVLFKETNSYQDITETPFYHFIKDLKIG